MNVLVNGIPRRLDEGATVAQAVTACTGEPPSRVAVAVNGEVVTRRDWETTVLTDGDRVEVVAAIQGGG